MAEKGNNHNIIALYTVDKQEKTPGIPGVLNYLPFR